MIKAYTDIEQSKNLRGVLPIESADMKILPFTEKEYRVVPINDIAVCGREDEIPCWSLAALRVCLPSGINIDGILYVFESHNTFNNEWVYEYKYEDISASFYSKSSNEIDACYELIIKLKEQKLL